MVEYKDGSVLGQLGSPDMRIPIQLALTWPERAVNPFSKLDLLKCGSLTFEEPDMDTFRCLGLAFEALAAGGTMPAAMNGANEAAVALFIAEKIGFCDIPRLIEKVMLAHNVNTSACLDDNNRCRQMGKRDGLEVTYVSDPGHTGIQIIVIVHEVGHFITARKMGIKVLEFSLFIGPKIFTLKEAVKLIH
jgi:1-deoxy-D-xylulose 5-phosphate reductoisomerase